MSEVMYAVVPMSRLDGTAARNAHMSSARIVGRGDAVRDSAACGSPDAACASPGDAGVASAGAAADAGSRLRSDVAAATITATMNSTLHVSFCACTRKRGSSSSGNASSASRLPALLAAYRKYGSPAVAAVVRLNQCWSSGAAAASTMNGSSSCMVSWPNSQSTGRVGSSGTLSNVTGSSSAAITARSRYTPACARASRSRVSPCAVA